MSKFAERLTQPGILIADGATGTMLRRAGLPPGVAPERWNLDNPDAIRSLHRSYISAGAEIILTNTFGGSSIRLERSSLAQQASRINHTAALLARQEAGDTCFVFGDIGPTGLIMQPDGPLTYSAAVETFAEQAAGLTAGGVDAILIETMSDLSEAKAAVEGVRQVTALPILLMLSFDTHGHTLMGVTPAQAAAELWSLGLAALGANCGHALSENLAAIREMRQALPNATLIAKPNAGLPRLVDSSAIYDVSPQIMAEYALKFADAGVKIFGGCCGSNPEHIRAIVRALKDH